MALRRLRRVTGWTGGIECAEGEGDVDTAVGTHSVRADEEKGERRCSEEKVRTGRGGWSGTASGGSEKERA